MSGRMDKKLLVSLLLLFLTGCGLKPLYASHDGSKNVAAELSSISIPPAENRLDQIIRNDLLSSIRPAGSGSDSRYTLELASTTKEDQAAKLNNLGADRRTVVIRVEYRLVERGSGQVVDRGRSFSRVSYDETGQSFNDLRAKDAAGERAAHEVSEDIKTRLAAHFAAG